MKQIIITHLKIQGSKNNCQKQLNFIQNMLKHHLLLVWKKLVNY